MPPFRPCLVLIHLRHAQGHRVVAARPPDDPTEKPQHSSSHLVASFVILVPLVKRMIQTMWEQELPVFNSAVADRKLNLGLAGESSYKRRFRGAGLCVAGHNPAENPRFPARRVDIRMFPSGPRCLNLR